MFATDPEMHLFHPIPLPPFPRWWLDIEEPFNALGVEIMLAVLFLALVKNSAHLFIFFPIYHACMCNKFQTWDLAEVSKTTFRSDITVRHSDLQSLECVVCLFI